MLTIDWLLTSSANSCSPASSAILRRVEAGLFRDQQTDQLVAQQAGPLRIRLVAAVVRG